MGTQNDPLGSSTNQSGPTTALQKENNIYEDRPGTKKIIRIITVMAYLFSVSFIAIVLSAYYIFLWQPPNPRLIYRAHVMDGVHADFLIQNPFEEQKVIDKRNKDQIFKETVWNENSKQRKFNISQLMSSYPNIVKAMTFENSSMQINENENHNNIFDKRSNIHNSMNNQFEGLKTKKNFEITSRSSPSNYINATKYLLMTTQLKKNSRNNNSSQTSGNNVASHEYVVGDNNINIKSLPPLGYHPITKLLLPLNQETYGEKSSQKSSTNQTKLIDKLKTICASTHDGTLEKSESRNLDDRSTIDPVVTTVKNRILELHEKNIDEKL
ncbi:uncharacterized protein inaF-D [Chelonus insularis]|uniref:uncharacterized protein inaF-D n=1 Tax=Chelonus insularis TaxID=460826 RepID=UPI00158AB29A|nr:uncharacterized protein LOC118067966 [Chelonus insularis]